MSPRVIGVIPSRFGAQRFPGKPLVLIAGVPMIVRVVRQAQKAKRLSEVWVATDDRRIAEVVEKAGAKAVMTSPALKSGTDRIAYAVRATKADIVVNIQGDEPVMAPQAIDAAVEVIQKDRRILMSTVVIPLSDKKEWLDPNVVKAVLGPKGDVLYFSRAPIPYPRDGSTKLTAGGGMPQAYKHMGLYGYRPGWLQMMSSLKPTPLELTEKLEQLRAMENGVLIRAAVRKVESIAVDVPSDVSKVERYLRRRS
ncbi:MAG TPA: 3-deoxy-manno-octulosonate cytidylyltransferase [bacterium]|nr:3-deoxy-manno-octulosonate cytidylyltransferase [bacterium]